jgi:death-on-curing protein
MAEVTFLTFSEVLEIHQNQIALYGGACGIRDLELLKSALGTPAATYGGEFLHGDIYQMASAYLFHIVNNHPFIDGNKRTGAVSMLVFLAMNGYEFTDSQDNFANMVIAVGKSKLDKAAVAGYIKKWALKL